MLKQQLLLVLLILPLALAARVERQANLNDKWWERDANNGHPVGPPPPASHRGEENFQEGDIIEPRSHLTDVPSKIEILPHEYCDGPGTKCVPYYNCLDVDVVTSIDGIPTVREDLGFNCSRYAEVCCRDISPLGPPLPPPDTDPICSGQRHSNGVSARITNLKQKETQFGEFPWMVAILRIERIGDKEINLYVCGGSIIGNDVVLTAAHCVADHPVENLKVRAGEWDTQMENEIIPHQERYVREIKVHPGYNNQSLWNNFALLFLDKPLQRGPSINTICLPNANQVFENRTYCYATGWGKEKFGKHGQFQIILKKIDLPYVPHSECEAALQTGTELGPHFILDDSFMCAGGELNKDTCTGDGGSPLVCNLPGSDHSSTFFQLGIVSWGIGCGEEGIPGVYADVRYGLNWIESVLGTVPHA